MEGLVAQPLSYGYPETYTVFGVRRGCGWYMSPVLKHEFGILCLALDTAGGVFKREGLKVAMQEGATSAKVCFPALL